MIFDTNILIYLSKYILQPEKVLKQEAKISIITKIETLGFSFKNTDEHQMLSDICGVLTIVPLTDLIAEETIRIRKHYRVKLPDAIIYATALVEGLPLLTNNIKDFTNLDGKVELIDPFNI